jgi:hypothetical protein
MDVSGGVGFDEAAAERRRARMPRYGELPLRDD